jgi:outer membrane biosynthesis protein TonB
MMRIGKCLAILYALSICSTVNGQEQKGNPSQAPAQQAQPPQQVRVSHDVMEGLLIKKVQPKYPKDARNQRVQGPVLLQVVISGTGDVKDTRLVSGHPLLAPAAIDAVKQWK